MKITRIDLYRVALPFSARHAPACQAAERAADPFNAASPTLKKMESLMVRLHTDTGLTGWGEAFGHYINPVTYAALSGRVGEFFLGRSIDFDDDGFPTLTTAAEHAFYEFGTTGPVAFALSAMDTALWDLRAKHEGLALHRLLAAKRSTLQVYASLPSYANDPAEVARQAAYAIQQGFPQIKLHETTPEAILSAGETLPANTPLMVDVNCAWSLPQARSVLESLRAAALRWIEEPTWPCNDLGALAACRGHGTLVAAGENAAGLQDMLRHIGTHAVDVAQPSIAKIGGVSAMLKIIQAARQEAIAVVPHCFYFGPGLCATAQIAATLPEDVLLEAPLLEWPVMLHPLQKPAPALTLPDTPGIGFEPDWEVLDQYTLASTTLAR